MAAIIKRKRADGSIAYRVQIRRTGYPAFSKTFDKLANARAYKTQVEADLDAGRVTGMAGSKGRTVSDVIERYRLSKDFADLKTQDGQSRLLDWWDKRIGSVKLKSLNNELIDTQLMTLDKAGYGGQTVNNRLNALSKALKLAYKRWHWLNHNPAEGVMRRQPGKRRERVITPREWEKLLSTAHVVALEKQDPFSPYKQLPNFLQLAYGTSARKGELRGLRWEDITFGLETEDGVEYATAYLKDTKNNESRVLVLVNGALEALRRQREFERESWPFVFTGRGPQVPAFFDTAFREVRARAGIGPDSRGENLVIHSIRHTVATELGNSGATEFEIMSVTGHKTSSQVKRYVKDSQDRALKALLKREGGV